jgi:hypothetical protein
VTTVAWLLDGSSEAQALSGQEVIARDIARSLAEG